ncbi:hypothetical protein [Streptomyces sp. NPDC006355]|uniref:hypothetical protein n=1 Tax=Streptomyces sp. NPDC006355 TaxID=3156758 RepID=UPI0033AF9035
MRSARMLLATATATAALAIAAPAAYAEVTGDRDHDTTSYSKEHDKDRKHHKPRGGVHTGGGALTAVTADHDQDGSRHDKDAFGDKHGKGDEHGRHDDHGKDFGHGKHHKPRGGVHTGGGALAAVNADDGSDGFKHDKDAFGDKHGKGDEHGRHDDHGKDFGHGKHHKPRGGVHTGGGALAAVNADDEWDNPKHDPDSLKDGERGDDTWNDKHEEDPFGDKRDEHGKHDDHGKRDDHEKGFGHGKHDKPHGGMHTGGGGLAGTPGVTAGGLAMLAVAGTGLYALRRQKASRGTA